MTVVLAPVPEAEDSLSDVRAEVWPLLERLDGQRTLQDAVALTRFDEFEAAKIACAMLFLGIVKRAGADRRRRAGPGPGGPEWTRGRPPRRWSPTAGRRPPSSSPTRRPPGRACRS